MYYCPDCPVTNSDFISPIIAHIITSHPFLPLSRISELLCTSGVLKITDETTDEQVATFILQVISN